MFYLLTRKKRARVHFLHIGKTGGSAIKYALKGNTKNSKYVIKLHNHETYMNMIPDGEKIIFFLRDPISRFVSGFYSRKRKGRPRYYVEWSKEEREVFSTFETPRELASALADEMSSLHKTAIIAMRSIEHFSPYKKWYVDISYFKSRMDDIFFIGFQETLRQDFSLLLNMLNIPERNARLPDDNVLAHKNPSTVDKCIDEDGRRALLSWYAEDYKFLHICRSIMEERGVQRY